MSDFSAILERLRELEESGHGDTPISAMSRAELIDYLGTTEAEVSIMSDEELRDAAEEQASDMAEDSSFPKIPAPDTNFAAQAKSYDGGSKAGEWNTGGGAKAGEWTAGGGDLSNKWKQEASASMSEADAHCGRCGGEGDVYDEEKDGIVPCPECGGEGVTEAKADPEIVAKFAGVPGSQRSYYIMKWAEEQGMDTDEAMELAGYEKGDYRGYGSYNWHYVGESEDAIEECGDPADMREQRLARRVIELTQRLQSFKEQLAEMDPAPQDPEEIKKQQTIATNLNQMKAAGVDIDPTKGTEDPAFNKEVGGKVAAAMADPALGQQLKGILGKVKD